MSETTDQTTDQTTDPVCGTSVTPATAMTSAVHGGKTYYFCSEDCYHTFMADPSSYTS